MWEAATEWVSWIHIDDEVGAIVHLLTSQVSGPVNLTAPNPVTYGELNTTMGDVMKRPSHCRFPNLGPKLLLGAELADSLLFTGQRVLPHAPSRPLRVLAPNAGGRSSRHPASSSPAFNQGAVLTCGSMVSDFGE